MLVARAPSRLAHQQLSPMSYFNMVSHNPPTIMIGIQASSIHPSGLKGGSRPLKLLRPDTARNITELGEFCCSIISEPFVEAANVTSVDAPPDIEEWALSGLTKRKSEWVTKPESR